MENALAVFDVIRDGGPLTRSDVARRTGLSVPTVARSVSSLARQGLVRPVGVVKGRAGRKAELLELDPASGYAVGVDVGEVSIRVAVADLSGTLLQQGKSPTEADQGVLHVLDNVSRAVDEVCRRAKVSPVAIGVGYPGVVDRRTGRVLGVPHIPGSEDFPIAQALSHRFPGIRVEVDNDVNLAALGECWSGAARAYRDRGTVVLLSFRTGIGSGIVVNGELFRGATGGAGEVGYLCGDPGFHLPRPGSPGWIECRAGGVALVGAYTAEAHRVPGARALETDLESLVDAYRHGDAAARSVIGQALATYGLVTANVVAMLDPDLLVLGGIVPALGAESFDRIIDAARKKVPRLPEVKPSELGLEATTRGALYRALHLAIEAIKARAAAVLRSAAG